MSRADMLQGINRAKNAVDKDGGECKRLVHLVIELAAEIWDADGLREDFCVQHVSYPVVVFGGVNRVRWSPKYGFYIDNSCCTDKFKARFRNIVGTGDLSQYREDLPVHVREVLEKLDQYPEG